MFTKEQTKNATRQEVDLMVVEYTQEIVDSYVGVSCYVSKAAYTEILRKELETKTAEFYTLLRGVEMQMNKDYWYVLLTSMKNAITRLGGN